MGVLLPDDPDVTAEHLEIASSELMKLSLSDQEADKSQVTAYPEVIAQTVGLKARHPIPVDKSPSHRQTLRS
jgi:hypothetical protein